MLRPELFDFNLEWIHDFYEMMLGRIERSGNLGLKVIGESHCKLPIFMLAARHVPLYSALVQICGRAD